VSPIPEPLTLSAPLRAGRLRRALLWGALLALLGVAQGLLLVLTLNFESTQAQEEAENVAADGAAAFRREILRSMQALQALQTVALEDTGGAQWHTATRALLRDHPGLARVELRDGNMKLLAAHDSPLSEPVFQTLPRADLQIEADWACAAAQRTSAPTFSRSYFVPMRAGAGQELLDLCIPLMQLGREAGFMVGSIRLAQLLEDTWKGVEARRHEYSIVEGDGTRVARAGSVRGAGIYMADRVVDLPGTPLRLRADGSRGRPSLVPNLATALVLGLSLTLFAVVLLLARDVRRRAQAERALAEALAFRKAMEDSLSTGLRARDLRGVVTYANPAFCAMVGYSQQELAAASETQPYWPTESLHEYRQRQIKRLATAGQLQAQAREGFETVFVRKSGERFPVMIYEAPLVNSQGEHTGWMSAVLDMSAQRRIEDLSRQQQERLQATARLATVGEMASLLSHELNQPLAAIASYASGSLNLLREADPQTPALLQLALNRIAEQAERAGRVIQSVHNFVRRRDQQHETVGIAPLLEAVLPLVRLQARKSGARVEVQVRGQALYGTAAVPLAPGLTGAAPAPDAHGPELAPLAASVRCDRTMVEQVLLNLTRNAIQAMEADTPLPARVLQLRVDDVDARWVRFTVADAGPGIAPEVAAQLFTPFFTTRTEGMGLGLSLCRTVVEQHGGALEFGAGPGGRGSEFRFTLPKPTAARKDVAPANGS
jgi:two-component system, LuxR family, sensor histidine kinase DctS